MALASAFRSARTFLTPQGSSDTLRLDGFRKAAEGQLFPQVDPSIDGQDCDHDCATCEIHLPKSFKIDETEKLYGHVKEWATHMLVATGKTDWVRDVEDEKGSLMEAVGKCNLEPSNGVSMTTTRRSSGIADIIQIETDAVCLQYASSGQRCHSTCGESPNHGPAPAIIYLRRWRNTCFSQRSHQLLHLTIAYEHQPTGSVEWLY